jgi:hypothetical protein
MLVCMLAHVLVCLLACKIFRDSLKYMKVQASIKIAGFLGATSLG